MDNSLLSTFLSGRELLFLGTGAAAFGIGATLLHIKSNFHPPSRARVFLTSAAAAFFVSGVILLRSGF